MPLVKENFQQWTLKELCPFPSLEIVFKLSPRVLLPVSELSQDSIKWWTFPTDQIYFTEAVGHNSDYMHFFTAVYNLKLMNKNRSHQRKEVF